MIYLVVTPAIMVVSLAAAMTVHSGLRGTGPWLRALLFLPVVTPTIVAAEAWRVLFREEDGLLNCWLTALGLDELWVVARGAPTESKTVVPLIYDTAFDGGSFGAACAIGVCLFVVLLAVSGVNLRLGKEEE